VFESFVVETRYHTLLPTQILSDVVSSEFQLGMALICIEGGRGRVRTLLHRMVPCTNDVSRQHGTIISPQSSSALAEPY
jgi:hypothetical protein